VAILATAKRLRPIMQEGFERVRWPA
jgi:hypothetical protein